MKLDLEQRARDAIPFKVFREAFVRVVDRRFATIEADIRRRCTDALAVEINYHSKQAKRVHRDTEYKVFSFGALPLKIINGMPRSRTYHDIKGVKCNVATYEENVQDTIELLDSYANEG